MSIASAFNNATSGLAASARAVQVVSSNIANALQVQQRSDTIDVACPLLQQLSPFAREPLCVLLFGRWNPHRPTDGFVAEQERLQHERHRFNIDAISLHASPPA